MQQAIVGGRRRWLWVVQALLVGLVVWLVSRSIAGNWQEFRALRLPLEVRLPEIALSLAAVWLTFAIQIESWRRILAGWGYRLPYLVAARVWCLANLGRYIPGKIWSIAGLVVLAQRAGVPAARATASAVVSQALAIGAGAALAAAAAPGTASSLGLGIAVLVACLTISALVWQRPAQWLARLVGASMPVQPLPISTVLIAGALTSVAWLSYGAAFWLLAKGLIPAAELSPVTAAGIFALGYILGWLTLFAPGGLGVRELVLVGLLTPVLGGGGALVVSLGSRILLTSAEAVAALSTALLGSRPNEKRPHEPS